MFYQQAFRIRASEKYKKKTVSFLFFKSHRRHLCTAECSPLGPRLGADHTQISLSKHKPFLMLNFWLSICDCSTPIQAMSLFNYGLGSDQIMSSVIWKHFSSDHCKRKGVIRNRVEQI